MGRISLKGEFKMKKTTYWMPRVLSILFICFLSLFSLDVFQPGMSPAEIALGLFMHNIPSIILIILLIVSWRREIIGALTYFAAGFIYIGFVLFNVLNSGLPWYIGITWSLTIALPAFVIGVLFLVNWKRRKENYRR